MRHSSPSIFNHCQYVVNHKPILAPVVMREGSVHLHLPLNCAQPPPVSLSQPAGCHLLPHTANPHLLSHTANSNILPHSCQLSPSASSLPIPTSSLTTSNSDLLPHSCQFTPPPSLLPIHTSCLTPVNSHILLHYYQFTPTASVLPI